MKVNREELLQDIMYCAPGLSQKELIDQSSCVVFRKGQVHTFNDEVACSKKTTLDITGAIPANPLIAILQKMVEPELDIVIKKGELRIAGKQRKAGIRYEETIALPLDEIEEPKKWKGLPTNFAEAIKLTQQCVSKDERKFAHTCLHFNKDYVESSDGFQAVRCELSLGLKKEQLIRRESIRHVINMGVTEISETGNWLHFRNPAKLILSCRKYVNEVADFLNLDKALKVSGEKIKLPKGLIEACERANVFSAEAVDNNNILVELTANKVKIRGEGVTGWFQETKKLDYGGKDMAFRIAPDMLMEISSNENYGNCKISKDKLFAVGENFVYVTSLAVPEQSAEETAEDDTEE